MNEIEKQYKNLNGKKDSDKKAVLLSALPDIAILKKLLNRKQNGKKKFSDAFSFDETMSSITSFESSIKKQLSQDDINYQDDTISFRKLSDIALKAKDEVKMESLKGDFEYLHQSFWEDANVLEVLAVK
jgi:hypothetical protein